MKLLPILIIFLFFNNSLAQTIYLGEYFLKTNNSQEKIKFLNHSTFTYIFENREITEFGKGYYSVVNDTLTLVFIDTLIKKTAIILDEPIIKSREDSIYMRISVYDKCDSSSFFCATVNYKNQKILTNLIGEVILRDTIPKLPFEFEVTSPGFKTVTYQIKKHGTYDIRVFLDFFNKTHAYQKGNIMQWRIKSSTKKRIIFQNLFNPIVDMNFKFIRIKN